VLSVQAVGIRPVPEAEDAGVLVKASRIEGVDPGERTAVCIGMTSAAGC